MPKYPQVQVQLIGQNGNVYVLIGVCLREAKRAGLTKEQVDEFRDEVLKQDSYDKALQTMIRYFDVS